MKTPKADNPVGVITGGSNCNRIVEELSILVEKTLLSLADRPNSELKGTNNILKIIDGINKSVLSENFVLVSFDVVNKFHNIDNESGLLSVQEALTASKI